MICVREFFAEAVSSRAQPNPSLSPDLLFINIPQFAFRNPKWILLHVRSAFWS